MNAEQLVLAILKGLCSLCMLRITAIAIFVAFKIPALLEDKVDKVMITFYLFIAIVLLLCADILIFCGLFGIK